jgi:hypothetical protein
MGTLEEIHSSGEIKELGLEQVGIIAARTTRKNSNYDKNPALHAENIKQITKSYKEATHFMCDTCEDLVHEDRIACAFVFYGPREMPAKQSPRKIVPSPRINSSRPSHKV